MFLRFVLFFFTIFIIENNSFSMEKNTEEKSDERPHKCNEANCNKNYKTKEYLINHKKSHNAIYTYRCDHLGCNKAFKTERSLKFHKKRHNNERPYKCDFQSCNKTFKIKLINK